MKKIIKVLCVGLCFVFALPLFCACSKQEEREFWLESDVALNAFVTEISTNANYANGTHHGEYVVEIINLANSSSNNPEEIERYVHLTTIYDNLFESNLKFVSRFQNIFKIKPAITEGAKSNFEKLNTNIKNTQKQILNFSNTTKDFNKKLNTSSLDLACQIVNLHYLEDYSLAYLNLINNITKLNENIISVLDKYYYVNKNIAQDSSADQLENLKNLYLYKSTTTINKSINNYLLQFNGVYQQLSYDKLFETLTLFNELSFTKAVSATTMQNYATFYTLFEQSNANFNTSIDKFDFNRYLGFYDKNEDNMIKDNISNKALLSCIKDFASNKIVMFLDATKTLN